MSNSLAKYQGMGWRNGLRGVKGWGGMNGGMGWRNNGRAKHGGMGWCNVYWRVYWHNYCSRSMEEWGGVMYTACEAWRNGVAQ